MKQTQFIHIKYYRFTFLLVFLTLLFSACISKPETIPPDTIQEVPKEESIDTVQDQIIGKTWFLAKMRIDSTLHLFEPEHGADIRLLFRKTNENKTGEISGSTGSNLFMGSWSIRPSKDTLLPITISPLGMTLMAPLNETAALFERNLMDTFETIAYISIESDSLSFFDSEKTLVLMYIYRGESLF